MPDARRRQLLEQLALVASAHQRLARFHPGPPCMLAANLPKRGRKPTGAPHGPALFEVRIEGLAHFSNPDSCPANELSMSASKTRSTLNISNLPPGARNTFTRAPIGAH